MVLQIKEEEDILIISMQQPGGNKFTIDLLNPLLEILTNPPKHVKGFILQGNGRIFSVGGDLDGMVAGIQQGQPSKYVDDIVPLVNKVILAIMDSPLPVVSIIDGSVAGGALSLAFSCDFVVARYDAKLSFAFGGLALSPDSGSSISLLTRGFPSRFLLNSFTKGTVVKTQDVEHFGVFDSLTDAGSLLDKAKFIISDLSKGSLWTFGKTKALFLSQHRNDIENQLTLEYQNIHDSCLRQDFQDRVQELYKKLNS